MSDAIPVHCRHCNEPLDVYQPFEDRFCSEECKDAADDWQPIDTLHRIDTNVVLWNPCDGIHLLLTTTSLAELFEIQRGEIFTHWRALNPPTAQTSG